jgi:hypothetical protein
MRSLGPAFDWRSAFYALVAGGILLAIGAAISPVAAQQMAVGTPLNVVGDSYFEHIGVGWSTNIKGVHVAFGGAATPPFRQYDPSAGIRTTFPFGGGDVRGVFGLTAAEGYRQNFVTQAPSVTMTDGQRAFFADASLTPFVVGYAPIVGGYPLYGVFPSVPGMTYPIPYTPPMPLTADPRVQAIQREFASGAADTQGGTGGLPARAATVAGSKSASSLGSAASSATRPAPSVAEARRLYEKEQALKLAEATDLFNRGLAAEADGKTGVAKIFYEMTVRRASGQLKDRATARLAALRGGPMEF